MCQRAVSSSLLVILTCLGQAEGQDDRVCVSEGCLDAAALWDLPPDQVQNVPCDPVLRSRNYLFSAPASAIYCHLTLYYNSSTIRNMSQWRFFFIPTSSKLTAVNIYQKYSFGSGSRSKIISALLAPAPQHCKVNDQCLGSVFVFYTDPDPAKKTRNIRSLWYCWPKFVIIS